MRLFDWLKKRRTWHVPYSTMEALFHEQEAALLCKLKRLVKPGPLSSIPEALKTIDARLRELDGKGE